MAVLLFIWITEEIFLPLILSNTVLSFSMYQQINEDSLKLPALLLTANNAWHRTVPLPRDAFGSLL